MMIRGFALLLGLLLAGVFTAPAPAARLVLVGDLMPGRGVAQAHAAAGSEAAALAGLGPLLQRADLALGNLESPLTQRPMIAAGYDLRAVPGWAGRLSAAGFDLLSTANNHSQDAGAPGLADTHQALEQSGITPLPAAGAPVYREVRGVRLAFLAFDDVGTRLDLEAAQRLVAAARQTGARVIVSLHWGGEYRAAPDARQRAAAQALADAGADLIWGHHPHVLQPVVWLQATGRPAPTLVAFSLGNALFDQVAPPDARRSAALWVEIDRVGVRAVRAYPLVINPVAGCAGLLAPEFVSANPCERRPFQFNPQEESARILQRLGQSAASTP